MNGYIEQKTSFSSGYMAVLMENGEIFSTDLMGNRNLVGVTIDRYNVLEKTAKEAIDKAEKYYNRLVELGDIVKPKTQEEIIQELCMQVSSLSNEIKALKGEKVNGLNNDSENNGSKPESSRLFNASPTVSPEVQE